MPSNCNADVPFAAYEDYEGYYIFGFYGLVKYTLWLELTFNTYGIN